MVEKQSGTTEVSAGLRMTVITAVLEWVSVLVVMLKIDESTGFDTTGGTPCFTGGIWIASDAKEGTRNTSSFTGGVEAPGSVAVVVRVIEVVMGVSLGLGDGQRK